MFVLDTNVLTAIMDARPQPTVAAWMARKPERSLFTAAVCQAEILAGIAILPAGRRRKDLFDTARAMFKEDFSGRVLPFDTAAAEIYAGIFADRRSAGLSTPHVDLMIAAVARARGAGIVTRNVSDFQGCGLTVINPWQELASRP